MTKIFSTTILPDLPPVALLIHGHYGVVEQLVGPGHAGQNKLGKNDIVKILRQKKSEEKLPVLCRELQVQGDCLRAPEYPAMRGFVN